MSSTTTRLKKLLPIPMKVNILSLIKDKLNRYPNRVWVYVRPWSYDYKNNRIQCSITESSSITIFDSYGEYPMDVMESIIDDHNGNLLIGISFDTYFKAVMDSHGYKEDII